MLSAKAVLELWEDDPAPADRPLAALAAWGVAEPAGLALDEVNRRLLDMRSALFGDDLECYTECPACAEAIEFTVSVASLRDTPDGAAAVSFEHDGLTIASRPPTIDDVTAAAGAVDPRRALCIRCVTTVTRGDEALAPADLPDDVMAAVEAHLDRHHPLLDITLAVTCPACGDVWDEALDVAGHLWVDIDRWARRLLVDVALLARAYGWGERDVLAMSPHRRAHYLELAR